MTDRDSTRRRIVILGGGMGAMAAAWALTEEPGWRSRYDITLYQMGWRLGGKGASGRNPEHGQRIEEHGLHLWLGFYDNAFSIMRRCYAELGREAGAPLARWDDAFKPHSYAGVSGVLSSHARWFWLLDFPRTRKEPGTPEQPLSGLDYAQLALRLLTRILRAPKGASREELRAVRTARTQLLDCARAAMRGLLRDRALLFGLDVLDEWDLRSWLRRHGASEQAVASPFLKGFYDLAFAYEDGDPDRPNFAAGAALRAILRTLFTYKGAIFWKMQAGMGDVVFAPLYEVLRRRGVRFRFFHRVEEVAFEPGKERSSQSVSRIRMTRQATCLHEEYEPLVSVEGLPCWPSTPRYEQLAEGETLRAQGTDLECPWDPWTGSGSVSLEQGRDFEEVVFGISLGAVPLLCPSLLTASLRWREMTEKVRTVATQAAQLWFREDLATLGWTRPPPVLDAYEDPFNTWADLSHLLPRESWPKKGAPASLAYLVGPLQDSGHAAPGSQGQSYLECRRAQAREHLRLWLQNHAAGLFPKAAWSGAHASFDWQRLYDPQELAGAERLAAQYLRANVAPSERYVQSLAGSTSYRIFTEDSGVESFYPVGDWVNTGINSGDIEAATISGLQAARALTERRRPIPGEGDGYHRANHGFWSGPLPGRRRGSLT